MPIKLSRFLHFEDTERRCHSRHATVTVCRTRTLRRLSLLYRNFPYSSMATTRLSVMIHRVDPPRKILRKTIVVCSLSAVITMRVLLELSASLVIPQRWKRPYDQSLLIFQERNAAHGIRSLIRSVRNHFVENSIRQVVLSLSYDFIWSHVIE